VKRRSDFFDAFLRGAGPSPELLAAFAIGLLVVSLMASLVYDLLAAPAATWPIAWRPAIFMLLLTGLAYLLYRRDRRRGRVVRAVVDESRLALPHPGLIWLFGPGPFDHLLFALEHHHKGGGAVHCWLVMQDVPPVRQALTRLTHQLTERELPTQLHPIYIQRLDVQAAYQAVRTILEREASEEGLPPEEVIADITGGVKPLTAGMTLAALTCGGPLEYVESDRDADGQPIPGALRVVLVDTTFQVTREE
jgi:hypothetical protein